MIKIQEELKQEHKTSNSKFNELTEEELKQVVGGGGGNEYVASCLQNIEQAISIIQNALPNASQGDATRFQAILNCLDFIRTCVNNGNYSLAMTYEEYMVSGLNSLVNMPAGLGDCKDGIFYYLGNI